MNFFFAGTANFKDFFDQHNEHRIVFPKIIFIILAFISKWDIRYELYFSVFLVAITFLALYKLSSLKPEKKPSNSKHLTNILTCILLFSLVQYENWLWGFQLAWFLINACLVIAVLLIALSNNSPKKLYLAVIPCFIASFSSAHGLLTWLATIPSVASMEGNSKDRRKRIIIWILFFLGSFVVYYTGYQKPSYHPSILFFLKKPLNTGLYFFTLLGSPAFTHKTFIISTIIGLILFLTFLILIFQIIKKYKFQFKLDLEVAAWMSIGLFTILFALMTTIGRAGNGIEQSTISRYTTSSVLLVISILHLARLSSSNKGFIAVIITGFILINSVRQVPPARFLQLQKQAGETCLELLNFMDESKHSCLEVLIPPPHTTSIRKSAEILEEIGFRKFPKEVPFITKPVKSYGHFDSPSTEGTSLAISKNGSLNLAGWATLPNSQELPKVVLFSHGSSKLFFADAFVTLDGSKVAKALNLTQFNKGRWSSDISFKSLPLGETVIKAWVYEPAGKQFVKLDGELKVNVVEGAFLN